MQDAYNPSSSDDESMDVLRFAHPFVSGCPIEYMYSVVNYADVPKYLECVCACSELSEVCADIKECNDEMMKNALPGMVGGLYSLYTSYPKMDAKVLYGLVAALIIGDCSHARCILTGYDELEKLLAAIHDEMCITNVDTIFQGRGCTCDVALASFMGVLERW